MNKDEIPSFLNHVNSNCLPKVNFFNSDIFKILATLNKNRTNGQGKISIGTKKICGNTIEDH